MKRWRLLDTRPMTAAENMALDDALLEMKGDGRSPDTIHFLQFSPRSVLVGFHQSVEEEIRTGYCRENGIEINRRTTGGGAIFFDESQIGWEVICDKQFFNLSFVTDALFRRLCAPVVTALGRLGLQSCFRPRNDIEINGRKISGTGGTEYKDAFLFQGTLLTDFDVDTMLKSLKIPVEKLRDKEIDSVKERVTCLKWELGYTPPVDDIKAAISFGFEKDLGITLVPGGLTPEEEACFQKKLAFYQSSEWIDQVKPLYQKRQMVQGVYKCTAGLIRFTLLVNLAQKRLNDIYITGDFLSFPPKALYDLESELRGLRLDPELIQTKIIRFFDDGKIRIPGMTVQNFIKPLHLAFEKIAIAEFGIPLELCNQISVTNGSFKDVLDKNPRVLLLPYCAKLIDCDLRHKKLCSQCGDCSVGEAWGMGAEKQLDALTVVNFEDLIDELEKMKSIGVQAFIGCCCEPFFSKHVEDFEQAGMPGILLNIDNTTCYDLDQAREAYKGEFANQTQINLELLECVLSCISLKNNPVKAVCEER